MASCSINSAIYIFVRESCSPTASAISLFAASGVSVRYCKISALRRSAMVLDFPPLFTAIFFRRFFRRKRQQKSGAIRIKRFYNLRLLPTLPLPDRTDTGQAASGAFTHIYQIEHFDEGFIARIWYAAYERFLYVDAESTRICNTDFIGPFLNHRTTTVIIIRMNQRIGQRFTQGFVHGCVINSVCTGQLERYFYVLCNAVNKRGNKNHRYYHSNRLSWTQFCPSGAHPLWHCDHVPDTAAAAPRSP